MPIAFWNEDYLTGNSVIDGQHKQLFILINKYHDAIMANLGGEFFHATLGELLSYIQEHFQAEEELMLIHQYPDYLEHKRKHEKLKKNVLCFVEDHQNLSNRSPIELSRFLQNWLRYHIKQEDKKFISYIKSLT